LPCEARSTRLFRVTPRGGRYPLVSPVRGVCMRRPAWRAISALIALATLAAIAGPLAAHADPTTAWTPGPGAPLDNTFDGFIDAPTANVIVSTGSFTVAGWFVDTTAEGWAGAVEVQVWLGALGGGGTQLGRPCCAQNRRDVSSD